MTWLIVKSLGKSLLVKEMVITKKLEILVKEMKNTFINITLQNASEYY